MFCRMSDQGKGHCYGERGNKTRTEGIAKMSTFKTLNGNQTIAEAARQVDPDVVAAYPITPSTAIVEAIAQFKADGLISGEFVCPEKRTQCNERLYRSCFGWGKSYDSHSLPGFSSDVGNCST